MRRLALLLALLGSATVAAEVVGEPPLIPRAALFATSDQVEPQLSPDGTRLAWLVPDSGGAYQLVVREFESGEERMITAGFPRGAESFQWASDSRTLIFTQDFNGDAAYHQYAVDLATRNIRDLTPWFGIYSSLVAVSRVRPGTVLVSMNVRDRKLHDLWRISLKTGAAELEEQNPGGVGAWSGDETLALRVVKAISPSGQTELLVRTKAGWQKQVAPGLATFSPLRLTGRDTALGLSYEGRDVPALVEKNLLTGAERVVFDQSTGELEVLLHPVKPLARAVAFDVGGRQRWRVLEPGVAKDFAQLEQRIEGDFQVSSMDDADTRWVISVTSDLKPTETWLWTRRTATLEPLFRAPPSPGSFAPMRPITVTARDGLALPGYLTVPPGSEGQRLPMVLLVHGGPAARVYWGFDPRVQWYANRGYAVLQLNFRGSTGYGQRFYEAGTRQWGLSMEDDLLDAVAWAVREGIADARRVAIVGHSYGGYAALAGVTLHPGVFRCAVSLAGVTDLPSHLESLPARFEVARSRRYKSLGDPTDPEDRQRLLRTSPLSFVHRLQVPVLIGHGLQDTMVRPIQSEAFVKAATQHGARVSYVAYAGEGHNLIQRENVLDWHARIETFLASCLGGKAEPRSPQEAVGRESLQEPRQGEGPAVSE